MQSQYRRSGSHLDSLLEDHRLGKPDDRAYSRFMKAQGQSKISVDSTCMQLLRLAKATLGYQLFVAIRAAAVDLREGPGTTVQS